MITDNEIIRAIEDTDSIWPEVEGKLSYLKLEHMTGCITPYDTFFMNRISKANLDGCDVDKEIDKIIQLYKSYKKPFAWIIGPGSKPSHLAQSLLAHGLKYEGKNDGMVLRDLHLALDISPDLEVKEKRLDDLEELIPVMSLGFGTPEQPNRDYFEMLQLCRESVPTKMLAVYDKKTNRPIACGSITYIPGMPLALLSGASTLPDQRGRGAYSALVKKRLDVAIEDNLEAVVIVANQETSSPICRKFKFQKLCEIDFYSYGKL